MKLADYVGKNVNIVCYDGATYNSYYIAHYWSADDDDERNEESIAIQKSKEYNGGLILFKSDIKSIKLTA